MAMTNDHTFGFITFGHRNGTHREGGEGLHPWRQTACGGAVNTTVDGVDIEFM